MTNLIIRTFIKNYENIKNPKVREDYGKLAGMVGIISNIILFGVKFAVGTIFSSVSVVADAVNNLADCASSLITLIGFKLAGKPADEKHPFGHARIEYLTGVIVSFVIIIIGFKLGENSLDKILNPSEPNFDKIVFFALGISILAKLWQFFFYRAVGRKISSETIFATGADSLNDVISTSAVLVAALITKLSSLNLDAVMGMAVAVFIIYSGIKLVIDTAAPLVGEAPDLELIKNIEEKILSYENVLGLHDLVVHNYGVDKCFVSVHCEIDARENILKSHDLIDDIERDFKENMSINLVIHMDPIVTDDDKTNLLKEQIRKIFEEHFQGISFHDFRVVWGIGHSNVVFDVNVPFSCKKSDKEIVHEIEEKLLKISPNFRAVITVDRI